MNTPKPGAIRPSRASLFLVLIVMLAPLGLSSAGGDVPEGWIRAGSAPADFDMGIDHAIVHAGKSSGFLKSKVTKPAGFGTLMQMCKGDEFHGKRVRMSAWVRSENVTDWAGLWMRVDGSDANQALAFDNMQSRPIRGNSEWKKHQIVLDVAPEAKDIAFGILLQGTGHVWLDGVTFEVVDRSVPSTGRSLGTDLALQPQNLDFEK